MSDNPDVIAYMIRLSEGLEGVRPEVFMGWYHSHPFDVGAHSQAFLSATDVFTQLAWQGPEDRAGNPWLALVVRGASLSCEMRGGARGSAGKGWVSGYRAYAGLYAG